MSYYRRIFEFSPEVIGLVDAEGNVLDVNKRVFDWLGFRPKEVIGKNFLQLPFLPEESKVKVKEKLHQALQNRKVPPYELDFLTKKGERRRGRVLVNPIWNDGGNLMEILVMALDITDQKRAEEALQESEKKYRTLAESAKDGIYIISLDGFEYVNPAFERIIGYKAKDVCRKDFNFFDLIHPEDRTLIAKREEARKKGKRLPPIYSFRCLTKDGKTKHVEVHTVPLPGEKVKILGILRDITQRKKQEEALRESEELFRSIVENSHAGILIVDGAYKFVYVNDELCRILGYPREEIIGQDFRKFLDEESRKLVAERYIRRQKGEKVPPRYEFNVVRKNGEKRRVEISSAIVRDKAGKVRTLAQILDITERKRAEQALQQLMEDYRGLFENAHDAIFVFTPDKEVILDVNPRACELYGYSRKEFLGMSLEDVSRDVAQGKRRIRETLKRGAYHNFETVHLHKDGREIFLEINAAVVNYKGQKAILSIHHDITERKRAEERLRVEKAYLDRLFESAQEGIIMADRTGRVIRVNSEFTRMFGYNREEVMGKDIDELVVPKKDLHKGASLTRRVAGGESVKFEAVRQRKDGSLIDVSVLASPIWADGSVMAIYAIYRDITERKRSEEKLRLSEEKYRNLVELSPDAILFLDMKGNITSCNTFMTKATGYAKEEIVGKHLTELKLLSAEERPRYMELLAKAARGEMPKPFEVKWIHKDQTPYLAEIRIGFIKEKEKKIGVQVVARDITERKEAEERIKASLKEREVMLREIHHRVKNNMQIISSLLRLQSRQIRDRKVRDIFDVGQNRIRSMALIHESLYQSKDLAKINFSDYIKRLTTHLFSIYRAGMEHIKMHVKVGNVFLDINRAIPCGLIINELVSNSLKHAFADGKKGEITVKMDADRRGKYILVVRDTGVGFPEDLDFYRTKTLGMQLVTDLVSQLEGSIELRRSKGTEFRIVF